jgi:hypothetical protein
MLLTTGQKARIATLAVIRLDAAITRGPQMSFGYRPHSRSKGWSGFTSSFRPLGPVECGV